MKEIPIRVWIIEKEGTKYVGVDETNIRLYENKPIPKLHTDLMQKIIKIEGIKEIHLHLHETPPYQDEYIIEFNSYTKMIKAIRKLDDVFGILYDGKMLIDLNENKVMIQW